MAQALTTNKVMTFRARVKHFAQGTGKLRGSTYEHSDRGDHQMPRMGMGKFTRRTSSQAEVIPYGFDHSSRKTEPFDYEMAEYTDIFDQAEVNYQEQEQLAMSFGWANGRLVDQVIIDALADVSAGKGTAFSEALTTVGSGTAQQKFTNGTTLHWGAGLHEAAAEARALLGQNGVEMPDGEICMVLPWSAYPNVYLDRTGYTGEIASKDYMAGGNMTAGMFPMMLHGMKVKAIDDRPLEGGLPSNVVFAYAKWCVGFDESLPYRQEVSWENKNSSWLIVGRHKIDAVKIDDAGIVRIEKT